MQRKLPIFQSAMLLTGVNLILRGSGTAFQIFLSRQIGAEGIGLLQLILSVGAPALVAGMAGIRTAAMYLSAEELGTKRKKNVPWVLRGCFGYSLICSLCFAGVLYGLAPIAAEKWIGNPLAAPALRLYSAFLPAICMGGVLGGYFTAARRILFLSAVEIGEQVVSIGATVLAFLYYAKGDALRSCMSVILGNGMGAVFCLVCLWLAKASERTESGKAIPVRNRILRAAVPLAVGDILRTGIGSTENLMVPKRLALHEKTPNPLAAFGMMSGMVFPIIMFPACFLFGLCEILIPEIAACKASGKEARIRYLMQRSLWASLIFGSIISGLLLISAESLCLRFYGRADAAGLIRLYAPLIPMLYCDAVTDACTKGLGQQKVCVRYNITTNALDVCLLFFLLPRYGLQGYFVSFLITHGLNFCLSLRRLLHITREKLRAYPALITLAVCFGCSILFRGGKTSVNCICYLAAAAVCLGVFRIFTAADIRWIAKIILGAQQWDKEAPRVH